MGAQGHDFEGILFQVGITSAFYQYVYVPRIPHYVHSRHARRVLKYGVSNVLIVTSWITVVARVEAAARVRVLHSFAGLVAAEWAPPAPTTRTKEPDMHSAFH